MPVTMDENIYSPKTMRKLDIQLVIRNELASPFTYQEFSNFLKTLHSNENLEFLSSVLKYQKLANPFYPFSISPKKSKRLSSQLAQSAIADQTPEGSFDAHNPVSPPNYGDDLFQRSLENIKAAVLRIFETYLVVGAPEEISLPSRLRDPLVNEIQKGHYHPDIFNASYDFISMLLRQGSFNQFLAFAAKSPIVPSEDDIPRVTLQQIIDRETLVPYAFQDLMEFLKVDVINR